MRLSDGGILVQLNGVSYCSYLQETILNFRVTINNQTVVFEKENDPSILRAPSPGKLLKFAVENADAERHLPVHHGLVSVLPAESAAMAKLDPALVELQRLLRQSAEIAG